jgi:serine O-acetyltransferase
MSIAAKLSLRATRADMLSELIDTICEKDPAARSRLEVILCYPGFHALALHGVAHKLYKSGHFFSARCISHLSRFLTGIEIHPGAQLGRRLFIDHGLGIVIGETAIVGDDVVLYQGVTLGAGAEARLGAQTRGVKRHPTIKNGVVIGSGSEVQGDITVGENSRIASMSMVLKDVAPNSVVVGIPGRIIRQDGKRVPSELRDLEAEAIKSLQGKLTRLAQEVETLKAQLGVATAAIKCDGDNGSGTADKQKLGAQPQVMPEGQVMGGLEIQATTDPVDLFLHGAGI